uniref:Putative serine/threonine-protein kinase fhkA n=1 Tax=Lygus hesperus TaxID=30085 RepID=A0A0A9XL57_LYGHE
MHDYFATDDNRQFILILDIARYGDLLNLLISNPNCLSEDDSREIFRQLLDAVDYLHSQGVVHRDIKPENILITDEKTVKITDFGLSKFVQPGSFLKTICGTPQYLAPEVLSHLPIAKASMKDKDHADTIDSTKQDISNYDKAVDLWSLGVILFI